MPKITINEAAALHFAAGVLKEQEVPVGEHRLAGATITIICPDDASVIRSAGAEGSGSEEFKLGGKITGAAMARFIKERCRAPVGKALIDAWSECIRETVGKKPDEFLSGEALAAAALTTDLKGKRRTPARRIGVDRATIEVAPAKAGGKAKKPRIAPGTSAKTKAG